MKFPDPPHSQKAVCTAAPHKIRFREKTRVLYIAFPLYDPRPLAFYRPTIRLSLFLWNISQTSKSISSMLSSLKIPSKSPPSQSWLSSHSFAVSLTHNA